MLHPSSFHPGELIIFSKTGRPHGLAKNSGLALVGDYPGCQTCFSGSPFVPAIMGKTSGQFKRID
jgi:hypothetical protein